MSSDESPSQSVITSLTVDPRADTAESGENVNAGWAAPSFLKATLTAVIAEPGTTVEGNPATLAQIGGVVLVTAVVLT